MPLLRDAEQACKGIVQARGKPGDQLVDEMFFVDLPDFESRKEIVRIHIGSAGRDAAAYNVEVLAARSVNLSGAELEAAIQSALFSAFDAGREPTDEDILAAISATVPLLTTMREKIDALRGWAASRAKQASSRQPESATELRRTNNGVVPRRPMVPSTSGTSEG